MNDRDNPPDKDELQDIFDDLNNELPDDVKANMGDSNDKSAQSGFMNGFNSKALGQDEMPDKTDSINQPPAQETDPSQNQLVRAP